jgi:hypothetical protein
MASRPIGLIVGAETTGHTVLLWGHTMKVVAVEVREVLLEYCTREERQQQ